MNMAQDQHPAPDNLAMEHALCWQKLLDYEFNKLLQKVDIQKPIIKYSAFQQPVTANTNIVAPTSGTQTLVTPTNSPCIFRIYICLTVSGVFSVIRSGTGTSTTEALNQGVALTAGAAYMFDILVEAGEKVDFQTSVTGVISKLLVIEKDDAK
jgi:hypothetical protein